MESLMTKVHKRRMISISVLLLALGSALALVMYALRQNINLFYTPTQIAAQEAPVNKRIRVGGMVSKGTVQRENISNSDNVAVQFVISDWVHPLTVHYQGILPDLFREGQGIVASGHLKPNGIFVAEEVLAKHDENYMPPEVAQALGLK
jgi:cytochrome c-type biogenesis protein CcmE